MSWGNFCDESNLVEKLLQYPLHYLRQRIKMASEDCNVKRLLKSLISIENKMVIVGPFGYHYTGRNAENKRENKQKEEIAWTALLSAINSPYLVSSKMKYGSIARDEFGTENKVYDELMRQAFYLKLKGRKTDGLKIEEKAKHLASKIFSN